MNRLLITSLLTGLATSALAQQNVPQTDQQAAREVHMQFTTASIDRMRPVLQRFSPRTASV